MNIQAPYWSTHQWSEVSVEVSDPQVWNQLTQRHHQKVHVDEELELLIEHLYVQREITLPAKCL